TCSVRNIWKTNRTGRDSLLSCAAFTARDGTRNLRRSRLTRFSAGLALQIALLVNLIFGTPAFAKAEEISKGLFLQRSTDAKAQGVTIVSADPKRYRLKLLTASGFRLKENLTAREWTEKYGLISAINAGMFQKDYRTSVGLLQAGDHVNNARLARDKA